MKSQKSKELPQKSRESPKKVGAFLFSEGTNDDLLLIGSFCTNDICRCYNVCGHFHFTDSWEPGDLYFREIFKKFLWNYSFSRVRFNSLLSSYLKNNYIFETRS